MSYDLKEHTRKLWKRIEVMEQKCEKDPSWMNKLILECMLKDYDAKQKLIMQDELRQNEIQSNEYRPY